MNLLKRALESDVEPEGKTIVMKGPLSEVYTQALNIAYSKAEGDDPSSTDLVTSSVDGIATESVKEKEKKKKKLDIKVKKNSFHEWLHKNPGEKITDADIEKGLKSDDKHVQKMAKFAQNAKKWHDKAEGKKPATESIDFSIESFDNIIMETQQMDITVMNKLLNDMNASSAPPTDNFQTVYGVSKDAVTEEDVIAVTSEVVNTPTDSEFILVLDAVTPSTATDIVEEKIVEINAALECIASAYGVKVFNSLKDASGYILNKR